jgi:hypothetical protein
MSHHRWLAIVLLTYILASLGLSAQSNPQGSPVGAQLSPLRIGVAIDESGSARGSGLPSAFLKRGLDWAQTAIERNGGDCFLVGFNDQIIISTELVTDVGRLRGAAQQLRPIGGSAVRDALVHAAQKFNSLMPEPKNAIRVVLFISDGSDNASSADERRAIERAKLSHVRVYAVGFPSPEAAKGRHLLESIAKQTGGKAFFPASETDMLSALADIDRDLAASSR